MEHGLEGSIQNPSVSDTLSNGVSPIMANFPDSVVAEGEENKTNLDVVSSENALEFNGSQFEDSLSSESDALVIDEKVPKKKRVNRKYSIKSKESLCTTDCVDTALAPDHSEENNLAEDTKDVLPNADLSSETVRPSEVPYLATHILSNENTQTSDNFSAVSDSVDPKASETETSRDPFRFSNSEVIEHSNPYFHESLFELSQLHHLSSENLVGENGNVEQITKPAKPKGQIKEYAQYLGLQPAVQFKCPKCGKSGFESLTSLQEHIVLCSSSHHEEKVLSAENVSGFKITRKVFLCSTCGTYYENWNLYLHMLEHHKRYICLYCLGMFSALDDLCQHIQSRHNVEPGIKETLAEFYNTYNDPCYIVCCECNKQFQEGDDFIHHQCIPVKVAPKTKSRVIKQIIAPENHITGDYGDLSEVDEAEKAPEENVQLDKDTSEDNNPEEAIPVNNNEGDNDPVDQSNCDDKVLKSDSDISDGEGTISQQLEEAPEEVKSENEHDDEAVTQDQELESPESPNQENTENTMDGLEEEHSDDQEESPEKPVELETRKVPKLSLKLPKPGLYTEDEGEDSNISNASNEDVDVDEEDKPNQEINNIESEHEQEEPLDELGEPTEAEPAIQNYPVAGPDIPIMEIELDQPLDKIDISILLQKCLSTTASTCIYCNHSRKIAVNGKQLGLHAIAEHRFSAINKSITEEELTPASFNMRIEECLPQLEETYFNLESGASGEAVTFSHMFECFQCHYSTTVHKELYLHNRKFHSKNLLLCIMCKTIFYSYSELICHLCPGVYVLGHDTQFRCCMCVSDHLPSSFRLMVHLRKRHNVCDVCLEMCHGQYKLSNHVWKHKLHHFCYRCGIAYRNKPDITRHLFWKHGTESVLCKKCLQKKWPHVYHFCVPPPNFVCEECNLMFTRAVSLKVHKRIHTGEQKHPCTWEDDCAELFISKKLMLKHLKSHTEPPEEIVTEPVKEEMEVKEEEADAALDNKEQEEVKDTEDPPKPVKPKVDVYDLPELNLSESESSDSESEQEKPKVEEVSNTQDSLHSEEGNSELTAQGPSLNADEIPLTAMQYDEQPALQEEILNNNDSLPDISEQVIDASTDAATMQDIWDNFKNYQANKEKMDNILIGDVDLKVDKPYVPDIPIPEVEEGISAELALRDHDYCVVAEKADAIVEVKPSLESTESMDHDYCSLNESEKQNSTDSTTAAPTQSSLQPTNRPLTPPRKRTTSTSSTSSGSDSSCSCGSNCSCSDSSSGSSSSTSDSSNSDSSTEEGRKRQLQRRLKRKERSKAAKKEAQQQKSQQIIVEDTESKPLKTEPQPIPAQDMPIRESDLETTESETDEEFYDREPLKFAKKILEEKRAQFIADVGPNAMPNGSFIESTSRPPTPPAGTIQEEETHPKRKKKTKKRKKRKSERRAAIERTYTSKLIIDPVETVVPPPPPSVPYYQQFHQTIQAQSPPVVPPITLSLGRNSPAGTPRTPPITKESSLLASQDGHLSDASGNVRASKRRRVPNKFYGYSSDEEDKPQSLKRSRVEINRTIPAPSSPMLVPPITIKTVQSPVVPPPKPQVVEPITLKLPKSFSQSNEYSRSHKKPQIVPPLRISAPRVSRPPPPPPPATKDESATESNDSDVDEPAPPPPTVHVRQTAPSIADVPKTSQPQLYCYCRCPYDEVSEMIGCDSSDCEIEWFHFECVGIMVPPKGQWFCPDCRKKKQQRLYS